MKRKLHFTPTASDQLTKIENDPALKGVLKQVRKTLGYLEIDPSHNSLQTHEFQSLTIRYGKKVFESYAQQHTPGSYRVFWYYGPDEVDSNGKRIPIITILAIIPHPKS